MGILTQVDSASKFSVCPKSEGMADGLKSCGGLNEEEQDLAQNSTKGSVDGLAFEG